ncbi:D,D-dipeptide ABC transporter permease [Allopusillimonas soli]|uniref:D,D-dipeptide ABC transporter permease n=1 Tax=Allopusillimonas soli TaxID=659016 RepID=A0A853FCA5_9BURK|nr:D,D-dipeptide ABC transporter permease [Allopusillimonas soli]NYT37282.1 D,D-dipeptide ABC transporter permease [Allopusillimonas soli]TEA74724.1 D,D-dipeptide ABC transporter permease [Allopusillimonas soli]
MPEAAVEATGAAGSWRHTWSYFLYQLRKSPLAMAGLAIIVFVCAAVACAAWIAPYDPDAINLVHRLQPPSAQHWFGTDEVGRDIFSRVLWGGRQSVGVGLFVAFASSLVGSIIGCFSGVMGGRLDSVIMRIMDIILSVPSLVLTMALAAALGASLFNAMLAITLVRIPFYVRLARGQALTLREMPYVKAAMTFGAGRRHIVSWHIARNALSPLIVQATLDIGGAILMAAALGFIGLGAQQPTAEWGAMVATGRNYFLDQWWYAVFPGFAILITAAGFNLLGDAARDMLDPKLKAR